MRKYIEINGKSFIIEEHTEAFAELKNDRAATLAIFKRFGGIFIPPFAVRDEEIKTIEKIYRKWITTP